MAIYKIEVVDKPAEIDPDAIPATKVEASTKSIEMKVGDAAAPLTFTVEPSDTTDEPEIKSGAEAVATWADGAVTAVAIGKTTITATAGDQSDACTVSVVGADQEGPVYTFNAGNMGAGNLPDGTVVYDNYFTIYTRSSSVVADAREFGTSGDAWYLSGTQYLAPNTNGGKTDRSVAFTTTAEKSTVEVWWKQNASSDATPVQRDISLDGTLASSLIGKAVDGTLENNAFVKNNLYHVTFSDVAAGEHYVAAANGGGEYIFQIVVTEEESSGEETKDITFTVPAGAELAELKAGTEAATLTEGKLTVAKDAVVTFKVNVTDEGKELDTVTGATEAEGVYTVNADAAAVVITLKEKTTTPTVNKEALNAAITAAETAIAAITVDTDAANVPEGTKWILATDKDTYQAAIVAAKSVADKTDATQTEVENAVTLLADATTAFEAAQKDGAKLKTMTVTAENVTATYDGTAKTIKVEGAPTGATITYCATSDGTYAATQPEMKYASDTAYTVYYKVTADGYETAEGSATITITKAAAPTILVTADPSDGIDSAGGTVTFTATGVPEGTLTGQCNQGGGATFTFAMNGTKLQGFNTVAANETSEDKTHIVSFTWTEHPNYEDAIIANVELNQVKQGGVSAVKATGLSVDDAFASKGVTAAADDTDGVTIAIDEATIRTAFAADKTAFQGDGVQHGDDAYIMVTFDAPENFDKTSWSVQQTVSTNGVKGTPSAIWKWDGSTPGNELDVVGDKIGDWFCILKGVTGDTPTMPAAAQYRMEYKFFDGDGTHVATTYYMVERTVTAAPVEYDVTVTGGTADKAKAAAGASVTVTAAAAPTGKVFDKWTATGLTLSETDAAKAELTFTMPGNAVTLTATYKDQGGETVDDATLFDPALLVVAGDNTPVTTDMLKAVFGNRFSATVITEGNHADYVKARRNSAGVTTSLEIKEDGKASFSFVIKAGETFDVAAKLSSNNSTDTTAYTLKKGDELVKSGDVAVSTTPTEVTWEGLTEGTYTLTSSGAKSIRIIRLELTVPQGGGGETVDTAALEAAITAAETAIAAITEDTDAANVPEGTKWILAADKATYQAAIDAAKAALAAAATQTEVEAAVTALATATTAFEAAQKDGAKTDTPVPPTVNKDALKADIAAAEELVKNTTFTAQEDNLAGEKYWDNGMKDTYQAAIDAAKAVADKADAEQTEVNDAKAALATATATFKAGKTDGTKVLEGDELKEALEAAINAATAAKEGVEANDATDPAEVANGTKYVPTAVMTALEDALKAAQDKKALLDDEDAENDPTAEELNAALAALKNATKDFQPETGTKPSGSYHPTGHGGVVNNPAKTETLGDGSTVTTTTDKNGNTTVVTKRPDGMETTTVTNKNGDMTITTVDDKGETVAEVKVPSTIPANDQKFVDVPEGHWAEDSINNMAALNMVKGVDDAKHIFDMNSAVTRGSVATILFRFANGKDGMSQSYSDVAEGQWYTDAVAWASKAGVVTGFEDGTFRPDGSITREQLAVMIYRYAKLIGLDVSGKGDLRVFNDNAKIQDWAVDGMAWCVKSGIINGRGDGTVDPTTPATRAEAAAMLDRFVALLK